MTYPTPISERIKHRTCWFRESTQSDRRHVPVSQLCSNHSSKIYRKSAAAPSIRFCLAPANLFTPECRLEVVLQPDLGIFAVIVINSPGGLRLRCFKSRIRSTQIAGRELKHASGTEGIHGIRLAHRRACTHSSGYVWCHRMVVLSNATSLCDWL